MRPNPKSLIDFFTRSLTTFQSSPDTFRILCTLPHQSRTSSPAPRRPSPPPQNLIILDASFNPPTTAHLEMARSALRDAQGSKRLVLLLAVNNADKAPKPASFPLRLGMMEGFGREVCEGDGGLEVDVAVTTLPYFHDKARAMREVGGYGAATQTFLAGFDTLIRIFNPRYYTEGIQSALGPFFEGAEVRVTMRPDGVWGGVEEQRAYVEGLEGGELVRVGGDARWARRVRLVDGWGEGVSSSRVREVVRSGEGSLDGLVCGEVRRWIEQEGLYRED